MRQTINQDQLQTTKPEIKPKSSFPKKPIWKTTVFLAFALLTFLLGVSLVFNFVQWKINRQMEAKITQEAKEFQANNRASSQPIQASQLNGTYVYLKNVKFYWSKNIYASIANLLAKASPKNKSNLVNFDRIDSFILFIQEGEVLIKPKVLEGMFNDCIFNYPESTLKNLSISITKGGQKHALRIKGNLKFVLWVPFEMIARLSVDQKTNTLNINASEIEAFGFIPVKPLTKLRPLQLEKLVSLPKNKHLMVSGNTIMVKPFGLFPAPQISGQMSDIEVQKDSIKLTFKKLKSPSLALPKAQNFIYLKGGNAQFRKFKMSDTDVQIIDQNQKDEFEFYLANYFSKLIQSKIQIQKNDSAIVTMPDY